MKITIDLNDESFSDYFVESDGTLDFTSAAIDMIIRMRRNTPCFSYGDISRSPFV